MIGARSSVPRRRASAAIYTAEPGTEDAERLSLLAVLGTQSLVG
jgi:hypothetical protein